MEVFFTDEPEWEHEKKKSRKRKRLVVRLISILIAFSLIITGLQVWFDVFNLPAIRFVEVSNRLSKDADVKEYKKAVVTIEWAGKKGTGFNIDQHGLIVTNEHVVSNTKTVNVHFPSGKTYVGKVIKADPILDLAIVEIQGKNLPMLKVSKEAIWNKGEKIIFIGNPLSFTQIANEGQILGEVMLSDWQVPVLMIEAPIYRGNSGSPVLNENGEVIGVIFANITNPSVETKEIIGVAVPSSYIETIIRTVK